MATVTLPAVTLLVSPTIAPSLTSGKQFLETVTHSVGVTYDATLINESDASIPQYRILVVDQGGTPLAELDKAIPGVCNLNVNDFDSFQFDIEMTDPKIKWVQPFRNEIQFWRGTKLLFWGPIVRVANNQTSVQAQCQDTSVYFTKRVFGPIPKVNLLPSYNSAGNTASVSKGWDFVSLPRSTPRSPPAHTVSWDYRYDEHHSMLLSSSTGKTTVTGDNDTMFSGSNLTTAGKALVRKVMNDILGDYPKVSFSVYDDNTGDRQTSLDRAQDRADSITQYILSLYPNATVHPNAPAYQHPAASNATSGGQTTNRRTVFTYRDNDGKKGHKQCARQFLVVQNPKANQKKVQYTFSAYGMIIDAAGFAANFAAMELIRYEPLKHHPDPMWKKEGYKRVAQVAREVFSAVAPHGVWIRYQTTVTLPNNGKHSLLEARLYPTNGDVAWSEIWLTKNDGFWFKEREQIDIVRAIVNHAQDESIGKSDLNIGIRTKDTGITRSREYLYDDRGTIYDALAEFPTLGFGFDWDIVITPTSRTFTTFYPRMGKDTNVVLVKDGNVSQYTVDVDGTLISTRVVVQGPGDMSNNWREERSAIDDTLMDGLVLEKVYAVTPNSPATSWQRQADRGLARYRRPVKTPTLTIKPSYTSTLLDKVGKNDRVFVDINDGWDPTSAQKYRVTQISLDPATDQLSFTFYPEDINQVLQNRFGAKGWKYLATTQTVTKPTETNTAYAARTFDDSGWSTGTATIGWVKPATGTTVRDPKLTPATTVPNGSEVWARKHVKCTGDMVLNVAGADWIWVYVNGTLIPGDYLSGYNVNGRWVKPHIVVPSDVLDPSGDQVVAIHCQYDPDRYNGDIMDSVIADVQVLGTYDSRLVP